MLRFLIISGFKTRKGDSVDIFSNCTLDENDNCLWIGKTWRFTDSLKTPMGPALDQRWEGKRFVV